MNQLRPNSDNVIIALRKIIQAIDQNSRSLFKRIGLTGPQLVILQGIDSRTEISVGELSREVSLSQATVTSVLERMESRGLVERRRSHGDRRRVLVRVTDAGRNLLESAPPLMQETFVEQFNQLPDWEQTMILSSLQRLVSLMKAKSISASPFLETRPITENGGGLEEGGLPPLA